MTIFRPHRKYVVLLKRETQLQILLTARLLLESHALIRRTRRMLRNHGTGSHP